MSEIEQRQYSRSPSLCLSCDKPFAVPPNRLGLPARGWVAFDVDEAHLWIICERCFAWNLVDRADRYDTVARLEWEVGARGVTLCESRNVRLVEIGDRTVVRIGAAELPEVALWRFGQTLRRRRARHASPLTKAGAAMYGALSYVGDSVGLMDRPLRVRWDQSGLTELVRWRRFGWAAWRGRRTCPNCSSVLRALPYSSSWSLRPVPTEDGIALSVPCPRCDFWTPENVYRLDGVDAETTLRRVLAYQHVEGADESVLHQATAALEHAGSVRDYCRTAASNGETLWRMPAGRRVALEIAVNKMVEERMLADRVRGLVARWRQETVLARIQDAEL